MSASQLIKLKATRISHKEQEWGIQTSEHEMQIKIKSSLGQGYPTQFDISFPDNSQKTRYLRSAKSIKTNQNKSIQTFP